jgi:hypothetical protein
LTFFSGKSVKLQPGNVYEDLSLDKFLVFMIFATQVIMIAFVVTDIFHTETHSCRDGTSGCPIVGTFGGWCFYIVGHLMSLVFLLGPKNKVGESEQNPSFWIQLLLCANGKGEATSVCKWYDPDRNEDGSRILYHGDWRIWLRPLSRVSWVVPLV